MPALCWLRKNTASRYLLKNHYSQAENKEISHFLKLSFGAVKKIIIKKNGGLETVNDLTLAILQTAVTMAVKLLRAV